ncbi:MAG: transporter [Verrucomicrobiota bacterium JB022]|nr:transporter [Verrucomicrobiota bacterium JB022]
MISVADYAVIALYLLFIVSAGVIFRKFLTNTSDYFRGGGKMFWWMAGSSAFMTQFSAWTFIGAAGKAYTDGLIILTVFIANAVGFFLNYLLIAPMLRQARVITAIQAIRRRLGPGNEQFYTWSQIPVGLIYAAIWLNAVSKFFAQAFPGFELTSTIVGVGVVVMVISVVGGAWAVSATDFIQLTLLMLITVVMSAFALSAVGGPVTLFQSLPQESMLGTGVTFEPLVVFWMMMVLVKQIVSTNSITNANRYLNARDSGHARGAALLACILFLGGSVIWFIPPLAASVLYPDLSAYVSAEIAVPSELAYVVAAQQLLPSGMLGLLIVGMFAATMSSMDSGLNKNAGFFVLNFYKPVLRKAASEKELFYASILTTIFMGCAVIGLALYIEYLAAQNEGLGLFEIMLNFGAMVAVPVAVPAILCLFIRRVPDWAGWSTALIGLLNAYLITGIGFGNLGQAGAWLDSQWFEGLLGLDLSPREEQDYLYSMLVFLNVGLAVAWFFFTKLFYRGLKPTREREVQDFFDDLHRPVEADEMTSELDAPQNRIIGWMATAFGGFMLLLAVAIPNSLSGRAAFLFCAGVLLLIGFLLLRAARRAQARLDAALRQPTAKA